MSQARARHDRPKRECLPPNDQRLSIAVLGQMLGDEGAAEAIVVEADSPTVEKVREHGRRRPLPESLPRVESEILPPEVRWSSKGATRSSASARRQARRSSGGPGRWWWCAPGGRSSCGKERERNAETEVLVGEVPELPIPSGLAEPGLLAATVVRRWQVHLPLNRLKQIYAREGRDSARRLHAAERSLQPSTRARRRHGSHWRSRVKI